jgi:hypothetical protein
MWNKIKMPLLIILGVSSVIGAFSAEIVLLSNNGKCTYPSLVSRLNPGYIITCELFRPRWK